MLRELVDEVFQDEREQLTRAEIQRRAGGFELPDQVAGPLDALPDGSYDRAGAYDELSRIQAEEGLWRDTTRTPLSELDNALATYAGDGQVDDETGHEAGPEEKFGDRANPDVGPH